MDIVYGFVGEGAIYASYLKHAYRIAQHSPDPSTQVGCVIVNPLMGVIASASNEFPKGISVSPERLASNTEKSIFMEHAERNALYKCSQGVLSTHGCHAYITLAPCIECARGLIQSGITQVVAHKEMFDLYTSPFDSSWRTKSIETGWGMLIESGIKCIMWSGTVFQLPSCTIRVRGKSWTP